jgi:phosphohistidine phosphatase
MGRKKHRQRKLDAPVLRCRAASDTQGGRMIELYFVRHGIAVERIPGVPDSFRELTGKGRRRFRKTARAFAQLGRSLDLILTSPLVRAVQTAEILAERAQPGQYRPGAVHVVDAPAAPPRARRLLRAP